MGNLNQKVVQILASVMSYNKITHGMSKPDTVVVRKVTWLSTVTALHGNWIIIIAHSQMFMCSNAGWVGAVETIVEC